MQLSFSQRHCYEWKVKGTAKWLKQKWFLTLNGPGVITVDHDVDHERELRRALAERLDQPQHAEVMGQVGGVLRALFPSPPHTETLPDC